MRNIRIWISRRPAWSGYEYPYWCIRIRCYRVYADIDGLDTLKGQSYRLTYSKMLEATNTSLNVAAYRFSTEDYLSLNDAASLQDSIHHEEYGNRSYDSNAELYADYQRTKTRYRSA